MNASMQALQRGIQVALAELDKFESKFSLLPSDSLH
jgi:hypothetical protein